MSDRRPSVSFADAFRFTLEIERTDMEVADGRYVMDDGTILRFSRWMFDNEVFPFRGVSSGPGGWTGTFPAEAKDATLRWCRDEGLIE